MARKRKNHDHEDHVDESWLIPYADLLTLLLALFIVLFASSSIDAAKYEQMAKSFNVVFTGGTGVMDQSSMQSTEETENSNQVKKAAEEEKDEEAKAKRLGTKRFSQRSKKSRSIHSLQIKNLVQSSKQSLRMKVFSLRLRTVSSF
ncbi:hypothetical protein BsIDN1_24360 [Bacillus safensis]|uniref:Motility protein B-like N-terminal domain-containing protein n=1 Tax=Bacillus safensis TaxID=561879 RepID=A0A5S9M7G5_BACIA|nr:hypothetical protein BsIDN1_24360 [Bacillus safensis]